MTNNVSSKGNPIKDDRILPLTRWVLILVIPFLLAAFLVLYIFPELTGKYFAWEIKSQMTARFIGSGYLMGAYLFAAGVIGGRWHRIAVALPAVTSFTVGMLLATFLHWDSFDIHHFPFQVWLILYLITPFLIPYLWAKNRATDPVALEPGDVKVPDLPRWGFLLFGIASVAGSIFMFIFPQTAINSWPWKLNPLTVHIMAGWIFLLGVGGLITSREVRWSTWKIPLQSMTLWTILLLIAAFLNPSDFGKAGLFNPFTVITGLFLVMLIALQVIMESKLIK